MNNEHVLKTGTTTVGIVCKEGIVMAADKRASAGYMVANKKEKKVYPINKFIAITVAGLVSDIQLFTKVIKAQLKLHELKTGKRSTVKHASNLLANIVYGSIRRPSMVMSIVGFLVGGVDSSGYHLFNVGIDGSLSKVDDYAADGSGMQFALGVLEANYRPDLTLNDTVKLAVRTINVAIQRDIATGDGINVVTITKDGVKEILEKELNTQITV